MGTSAKQLNYDAQIATNESNERIAAERNQHEMELWHEQQQHDIDMWNMENQYNTPTAQVKRLQDAGLNPSLIYGSGSSAAGNASSFPGGQSVPDLVTPQLQAPQYDNSQISAIMQGLGNVGSFMKNVAETSSIKAQTQGVNLNNQFFEDMSRKGMNPEMIKASYMLQQYNNLKAQGKYISPYMEQQIKKIGSDIDFQKWNIEVRKLDVEKIQKEIEFLGISNKFNAEHFINVLSSEVQAQRIQLQQHFKNLSLADAQINAANAGADASRAQAGLLSQETATESFRTMQERLRGLLAQNGINPNDKNLPFFTGVALKLMQNPQSAPQIQSYFENLAEANKIGYSALVNGNADLTKYQLYGEKGLFGTGINVRETWADLMTNFMNNFGRHKVIGEDENGLPIFNR